LRGAQQLPRDFPNVVQPNAITNEIISRGDSVAILEKKKAAPKGGFPINADLSASYLVAGIGFEPMTFRL
jgi:hypothetical protein